MKRVCLISFYNLYQSKRHFAIKLEEALHRKGVETLLIDPADGVMSGAIQEQIKRFDPDFTLSFNSSQADQKGRYYCDYLGIPHLMALVDPAFYSIEFSRSPLIFFTSVDKEDCHWFRANGVRDIYFWPHAVEIDPPLKAQSETIYDLVFLGTCTDYEGLRLDWHQKLNEDEILLLDRSVERMLTPPLCSLTEALASSVSSLNLKAEQIDFKGVFYYLDNFVRGKDRFELIRSLKGVQVHIFGEPSWNNPYRDSSWKQYFSNHSHVILHPAVSYQESFGIMQQAKICLNSSPFFVHGSHERILNALVSGAVPLTTHNHFIEDYFSPGKDLLTYVPGQWGEAYEQVQALLADDRKRLEMVERGKAKVLASHTWDNRVDELFSIWKEVKSRFGS